MRNWKIAAMTALLLLAAALQYPGRAQGEAQPPLLRIALDSGKAQITFQVCQGEYDLLDGSSGVVTARPEAGSGAWKVSACGPFLQVEGPGMSAGALCNGPLLLKESEGNSLNLFQYKGNKYRGNLVIQNLNGTLLVVNSLDVERYLYGVVGLEMGGSSVEALCAQAVASRSFALSLKGSGTWFDLYDDERSQVYRGYSGEEACRVGGSIPAVEAVDRTRGEVLEYQGQLVEAYYHANAGGYTEDSENVWSKAVPYLRATPSIGDEYATSWEWSADSYSWTKTVSKADLEARLGVGEIRDLQVSRNRSKVDASGRANGFLPGTITASGRVTMVTVIGSQGSKSYYRDSIRGVFGLKSTLFDLSYSGKAYALDASGLIKPLTEDEVVVASGSGSSSVKLSQGAIRAVGSGNRVVAVASGGDEITFRGKGYGHGLGMSQWGARGLAAKGYKYQDILEIYYNQGKHDGKLKIAADYGA